MVDFESYRDYSEMFEGSSSSYGCQQPALSEVIVVSRSGQPDREFFAAVSNSRSARARVSVLSRDIDQSRELTHEFGYDTSY